MPLLACIRLITPALAFCAALALTGCDSKPREKASADAPPGDAPAAVDIRRQAVEAPAHARRTEAIKSGSARETSELRKRHVTTGPEVLVTGRVRGAGGAALTSITVELWQNGAAMDGSPVKEMRHAATALGENGSYQLRGPDGTGLRVEVAGASRPVRDISDPNDMGTTEARVRTVKQDFVLPALHSVAGKVVDASDAAIPAALVSLRSEDAIEDGWYYANQKTMTGSSGEFRLDGVAEGNVDIGASAPGYPPTAFRVAVPTSGPLVIKLTTGTAAVQGRVVRFPGAETISGAQVSAVPQGPGAKLGLSDALKTTADQSGNFTLGNLPAGPVRLSARNPQWKRSYAAPGAPAEITLRENSTTETDLVIYPGWTLTGTVFDKETSEPLAGAHVLTSDTRTSATTNQDGVYRLEGLAPGMAQNIEVGYRGFMMAPSPWVGGSVMYVNAPNASDHVTQDIPMVPVVRVSGRVENEQKEGIAGAEVAWRNFRSRGNMVTSGLDGNFMLEVGPFESGLLEARAKGYGYYEAKNPTKVNREAVTGIVITLQPEARVEGRVVNSRKEGVGGAVISTQQRAMLENTFMNFSRELATAGPDGRFTLEGLEERTFTLNAKAQGYAEGSATVKTRAGETAPDVEILLEQGGTIEGRVVNQDGKPVPAVLYLNGSGSPAGFPDSAGKFKLEDLRPGKYRIRAMHRENHESKEVEAEVGATDVEIVLGENEMATIHGRVVEVGSGKPITNFDVVGGGRLQRDGEGPNGFRFEMEVKQDNSYSVITITAPGYAKKNFDVPYPKEPGHHERKFEMGVGGILTGRVVQMPGRTPLANVTVGAGAATSSFGGTKPEVTTYTDAEGRFTLSGVVSGEVLLQVFPSAPLSPASVKVQVTDEQVTDAGDIEVGGMGRITGRVEDATGTPSAGKRVFLNGPQGQGMASLHQSMDFTTDPDGRFATGDIPPGEYSLHTMPQSRKVTVKPGEATDVLIRLGSVTMNGTVTRGGKPVTMGSVRLEAAGGEFDAGGNIRNGQYSVTGLTSGAYTVALTENTTTTEHNFMGGASYSITDIGHDTVQVPDQPQYTKDFVLP